MTDHGLHEITKGDRDPYKYLNFTNGNFGERSK
jgi:hypothetical protein